MILFYLKCTKDIYCFVIELLNIPACEYNSLDLWYSWWIIFIIFMKCGDNELCQWFDKILNRTAWAVKPLKYNIDYLSFWHYGRRLKSIWKCSLKTESSSKLFFLLVRHVCWHGANSNLFFVYVSRSILTKSFS